METHAESFLNKNAAVPFRRFGDDLITPGSFEKFAKSTGANSQLTIKLIVNDVNLKNSGWGEYAAAFGDAATILAISAPSCEDNGNLKPYRERNAATTASPASL